MKSVFLSVCIIAIMCLGLSGCSVKVQPVLGSSLGIDAFENMGTIDLRDVDVALYIDPELRNLKVNQNLKMGKYTFDMGSAFSVKFIKAISYKFRSITLVQTPMYPKSESIDALIRVGLKDVDVNMDVKSGFSTVSTESYTRLSIRAEIRDTKENRVVWVGATQAKDSRAYEEMGQMTYQEAGRGFAVAIDRAIDKAIGSLIMQMSKSENLQTYMDKWEN